MCCIYRYPSSRNTFYISFFRTQKAVLTVILKKHFYKGKIVPTVLSGNSPPPLPRSDATAIWSNYFIQSLFFSQVFNGIWFHHSRSSNYCGRYPSAWDGTVVDWSNFWICSYNWYTNRWECKLIDKFVHEIILQSNNCIWQNFIQGKEAKLNNHCKCNI